MSKDTRANRGHASHVRRSTELWTWPLLACLCVLASPATASESRFQLVGKPELGCPYAWSADVSLRMDGAMTFPDGTKQRQPTQAGRLLLRGVTTYREIEATRISAACVVERCVLIRDVATEEVCAPGSKLHFVWDDNDTMIFLDEGDLAVPDAESFLEEALLGWSWHHAGADCLNPDQPVKPDDVWEANPHALAKYLESKEDLVTGSGSPSATVRLLRKERKGDVEFATVRVQVTVTDGQLKAEDGPAGKGSITREAEMTVPLDPAHRGVEYEGESESKIAGNAADLGADFEATFVFTMGVRVKFSAVPMADNKPMWPPIAIQFPGASSP